MRVSKVAAYNSLKTASNIIADASGGDGRTSRADIEAKLKTLQGTEKALVSIFYKFIDHRDAKPGASVTPADLTKALAYAKRTMIDQYDTNNNGLSKSEIARMSTTSKLAVKLAQERRAGAPAGRDIG